MNTLKITAVAKCLLPGRPSSRNTQHEKRYTFITQILQVCAFDSSSSSFRPTFYLLYVYELEPNRQSEKKEERNERERKRIFSFYSSTKSGDGNKFLTISHIFFAYLYLILNDILKSIIDTNPLNYIIDLVNLKSAIKFSVVVVVCYSTNSYFSCSITRHMFALDGWAYVWHSNKITTKSQIRFRSLSLSVCVYISIQIHLSSLTWSI